MTRYALALVLSLSGCATSAPFDNHESTTNTKDSLGRVVGVVAICAVVGLAYVVYEAFPRPAPKAPPPLPHPDSVWGTVVWADSGKHLPSVALTLRGQQGVIARTTSDGEGNFRFPTAPARDATLTVTIEDDRAEGFNEAAFADTTIVEAHAKKSQAAPP